MYEWYLYSIVKEDFHKISNYKKIVQGCINNMPAFFTKVYVKRTLTF